MERSKRSQASVCSTGAGVLPTAMRISLALARVRLLGVSVGTVGTGTLSPRGSGSRDARRAPLRDHRIL